jgi:hypothetical protein
VQDWERKKVGVEQVVYVKVRLSIPHSTQPLDSKNNPGQAQRKVTVRVEVDNIAAKMGPQSLDFLHNGIALRHLGWGDGEIVKDVHCW